MSDIFISYASEDRPKAEALAKILESRGWSVWWDRSILPGKEFDEVIQEALTSTKCVVVLWSGSSVASRWVRTEAEEGANRNILVPAWIEDVQIPLAFKRIQAARLLDWDGGPVHLGIDQISESISGILAQPRIAQETTETGIERSRRLSPLLLLSLPTILVAVAIILLMLWRMPTRVAVELTVNRAEFTVGGKPSQLIPILGPADFQSLTVEKFVTVELEPETIQVADPVKNNLDERIPESAWRTQKVPDGKVLFTGKDTRLNPAITFEGAEAGKPTGRLDAVWAHAGSETTVESRGQQTPVITVKLQGEKPKAILSMSTTFQIFADHTVIRDVRASAFENNSSIYRVRTRADNPPIEITGEPQSLVISLKPPSQDHTTLFSQESIPISDVDFTGLNEAGTRVSALTAEGHLSYPDYPELEKASFQPPDVIGLDKLKRFHIKEISVDPTGKGLRFRLDGVAGHAMTKSGDFQTDHRLTGFDVLCHNPRLAVFFAILVWVFPTTLGAYRLWKEFNR